MRILALDLGTQLGFCLSDLEAGTVDLSGYRGKESPGMRFIRFRRWLRDRLDEGIDLVVYEDVRRHQGVQAAHIYGGLLAILQAECDGFRRPGENVSPVHYACYGVGQIKKFATRDMFPATQGKGNASKEQMVAAALLRWPRFNGDHNEADARFIRECALREWGE